MNDTHFYEVNLLWDTEAQSKQSYQAKANNLNIKTPPEWSKGKMEKLTAEHLFVSAVNSCLMSTFLLVANNSKFQFISFESNAVGRIENLDGKLTVTEIILTPTLIITSTQNETKAKRVLNMSKKACAIANSIITKITLKSIITV